MLKKFRPAIRTVVLAAALGTAVGGASVALGADAGGDTGAGAGAGAGAAPVVVEVTGDDVNLRSGPSIDHHDLGQVSRGQLLIEEARDDDFVRVRVPGGVPVYVFATLLDWEEGALRCTVAAGDVLMRATPTTAHYPLHDQKLQRGAELFVIGVKDTAKGRWLRVVAPPSVHVWIHERYVRAPQTAPASDALDALALERLDALTGGRTREERERLAKERSAALEQRLLAITKQVDGGSAKSDVLTAVQRLALDAGEAGEPDLRVRALALAERIEGRLERLRAEAQRDSAADAAEQAERERAAALRRQQEIEELRRRRAADAERERRRRVQDRGTPAAEGVMRMRGGHAVLEKDGVVVLDLRSQKFRLGDYAGRRVRLWGHRQERENARDRLEITSLEVVPEK